MKLNSITWPKWLEKFWQQPPQDDQYRIRVQRRIEKEAEAEKPKEADRDRTIILGNHSHDLDK